MIPVPRDKDFFIQAAIFIFLGVLTAILSFDHAARDSEEINVYSIQAIVTPLSSLTMMAFFISAGVAISMGRLTRHYEKRFEEMTAEIQRLSAGAESPVTEAISR